MEQIIIKYIKSEFHRGRADLEILPDDDLLASGLVESMSMMRLIQFIEQEFGINVAPQDMTIENFMNVEVITKYIKQCKMAS